MTKNQIILLFQLIIGFSAYSQTLEIRSIKDSIPLYSEITIIQSDKTHQKIYTSKSGIIDFPDGIIGSFLEINSDGFETKIIPYSTTIPPIIYLQPIIQHVNEMVVTGQMQQTTISDAVQSVRIISSKKIEQMGAQNLNQLLKNELNIQLSNDPVLGSSMKLQGIGGENIKFLIDGVPMIGRLNGSVDLDQINLTNVERIEIIEGPLSVNYGSDALAGTINIITKSNYSRTFQAIGKGFYESNGTYNTSLTTAFQFKQTLISVDVNRNYFDGWKAEESNFHVEKEQIADTFRTKTFKPREQLFAGIKINQLLKKNVFGADLILGLSFRIFDEEILNRGTPFKPYFIKAFDEIYQTTRIDNSISITGSLSKKWKINSTNAYNFFQRQKNTYSNNLITLNQTLTNSESDQDTSSFDLWMSRSSFIYVHSKSFSYEFGYDVNYENSRGQRIDEQEQSIGDYALFATSEMTLFKKLVIKPGIRASYNSVYSAPIIPSIFLKYKLTEKNSLRFSYSRGFRAPSLKELYFFFVDINHNVQGNQDLKAEKSNNYQLALRTNYAKDKFQLTVTNQVFFNEISNVITLAQINTTEYSYINLLRARTVGYTINANISIKKLAVELGGNFLGNQSQVSESEDAYKIGWYPEFKINPSYKISKINTTFSIYYKFTGQIPSFNFDTDGNLVQTKRDSYNMLDATATTNCWKNKVRITLGVKNLFNVQTIGGTNSGSAHSSSASSIQIGMGRTYFCSLSLTLNSRKNALNK